MFGSTRFYADRFEGAANNLAKYPEKRRSAFTQETNTHKNTVAAEVNAAIAKYVGFNPLAVTDPLKLFNALEKCLRTDFEHEGHQIKTFGTLVIEFQHQLCFYLLSRPDPDLATFNKIYATMLATMQAYIRDDSTFETAFYERLTNLLRLLYKSNVEAIRTEFVDKTIELYNKLDDSLIHSVERRSKLFDKLKSFIKDICSEAADKKNADFNKFANTLITKYNVVARNVEAIFDQTFNLLPESDAKSSQRSPRTR